jgi:hypothetical protein
MTASELLKLSASDPTAFAEAFRQFEESRKAKRRATYKANPEKFRTLNQKWREAHLESERERAQRNAAKLRSVRDLYRQLTQEAA